MNLFKKFNKIDITLKILTEMNQLSKFSQRNSKIVKCSLFQKMISINISL
jgi:hypothetical protein